MKNVIDNNLCTGCTTCFNSCPVKAIEMVEDKEGFLHAKINEEKCIKCGLCLKVCPVLHNKKTYNKENLKTYAAINKNINERITSSSGGIFPLLSEKIIKEDGMVVGCFLDENLKAKHIIIDKIKDINKLKGSKYIQSELSDVFKKIKENIENKKILFVGTPCQVAGIKMYLNNHKNLITCELVCHGVPSYKSFHQFLREKYPNEKISEYLFKDKSNSWKNYDIYIKTNNHELKENVNNNEFMQGYLNECYTRDCCFDCHFKGEKRVGDITLGDFWGINKINPKMDDDKGTSLVLINSEKGLNLFNKIKSSLILSEESLEEAVKYNPAIIKSPSKSNKDKFEMLEKKFGLCEAIKKIKKTNLKKRIKSILNYLTQSK